MKKLLLLLFVAIMLSACAGPSKKSMLPDGGPTTMQVYEEHMGGGISYANTKNSTKNDEPWDSVEGNKILPRNRGTGSLVASQLEAIKKDFRKVDNPEIVGYVYPHLSTNDHPVPGYFTAFSLYSGEHYAISPNEGQIQSLRITGGY